MRTFLKRNSSLSLNHRRLSSHNSSFRSNSFSRRLFSNKCEPVGEAANESLMAAAAAEPARPMNKFQYFLTLGLVGAGGYALYKMVNGLVENNTRPEMVFPMRDFGIYFLQRSLPHIMQDKELVAHFGGMNIVGENFGINDEGMWYLLTVRGDKNDEYGVPKVGTAMLEMVPDRTPPPDGAEPRTPFDWVFLHIDIDLQNGDTKRFVFAKKTNLEETMRKMWKANMEMQKREKEREMNRNRRQQQQQ